MSCFRDQGHPTLFFFPSSGAWEEFAGFEELIHGFLWRLSSFLMNWKEALNAVGYCSSVYTHTFSLGPLTVAAARSISKAYVSQLWPQCQVPSNPWGCPGVWIKFKSGDREYVWPFEGVRWGPTSWALQGINLISESHNSLLTPACICPVDSSSIAAEVFFSGRIFWYRTILTSPEFGAYLLLRPVILPYLCIKEKWPAQFAGYL